jgi:hypothetical protein
MVLGSVVILGLALWGAMLWLTYGDDNPNDLLIHLGETGATLAFVTVLGGLVRAAFMQRDKTRQKQDAKHAFYRSLLADLKSVYDRVESCRLLVEAHQSAKTYGEQVRALVGGVVTLHNIKRALDPGFPKLKEELAEPIDNMTGFIKELLKEFRDQYREISRLQEADEAWNKYSRENLPKEEKAPEEYKPLSRAWAAIQKLPKLTVLRDDSKFDGYKTKFLDHLDHASRILRTRLPIEE